MSFVRAQEGPANYGSKTYTVQYFDENGNMTIRSGGTKAWRNNNPGNLKYQEGSFAHRHGAIGKADGMAVFPTEAIGRKALVDLLKIPKYWKLTITEFPETYDKENAKEYRRMLLSISKLDPKKRICDLTLKEFDQFREAIERIEGWEAGGEDFIEKSYISGVHKKLGVIVEYLINEEWLSTKDALRLAMEGKLHAILLPLKKCESASVGQPVNLNPPASLNLFKLSCFGAGFAWFKFTAPPWHFHSF